MSQLTSLADQPALPLSRTPAGPPRVPGAARDLLSSAARGLVAAEAAALPREQYALAHLAALRTAAAVLACCSRPNRARRPRSAWELLEGVAPEFSEWAAFFAAGARKRAGCEAGLDVVSAREAADLVRDSGAFFRLVCERLGLAQPDRRAG